MTTPRWMPPLPEKRRRFFCTKCGSSECTPDTVKDKHPLCVCGYLGFGEDCDYNDDEMRDYGRQCVEDYKKSLKPEMWGILNDRGGWIKVAINGSSDEEMLILGWIPLYRIDGGNDDAA